MAQPPVIRSDGSAIIGTQIIQIPNTQLDAVVGAGANGWIFRGTNPYINRTVAVKIWTKLRPDDDRDKFRQGIAEAKKTAEAAGENVISILDAGEVSGYFYTLMEFFPGITLGKWLETCHPNLAIRWHFARQLLWDIYVTTSESTCHGDLHTNNILVATSAHEKTVADKREFAPSYKIIDFGTSIFTTKERSLDRHWRVFNETFTKLLYPLNINILATKTAPKDLNLDDIYDWYEQFLDDVPHLLVCAGVSWLRPIFVDISEPKVPEPIEVELKHLVAIGKLPIDYAVIGRYNEWYI